MTDSVEDVCLVSVMYGEQNTLSVNGNCSCRIVCDYIRRAAEYFEYEECDLAEKDSLSVVLLHTHPEEKANVYLKNKKEYILVRVVRGEEGAEPTYEALYKDENGSTPVVGTGRAPPGKKK